LETLTQDNATAVAEFVRLFAHELNNPLATIRMSSEMLQAGTLPPDMQKEIVEVLFNETLRMEQLIEQAVYFTSIPPATPLSIETQQIVDSVVETIDGGSAVQVRNHLGADPVQVDVRQMGRLLREVICNALESGAANVGLEVRRDGDDTIFEVRDDGEGISPSARGRIYQPFYTTREGKLGLGLSTAKRIAEMHGGSIEVMEAVPVGTIVSIRIPNSLR
jgi:signal transduction histidine kinase